MTIQPTRLEIGASYPETPEGMTDGEFAEGLFNLTFPVGYTPHIDIRTPSEVLQMFTHEERLVLFAAIPETELLDFYVNGLYRPLVPGETWKQFVYGGDTPNGNA